MKSVKLYIRFRFADTGTGFYYYWGRYKRGKDALQAFRDMFKSWEFFEANPTGEAKLEYEDGGISFYIL